MRHLMTRTASRQTRCSMRVLVCGGRNFADRELLARTLAPYKPSPANAASEHKIIEGGARGADSMAREWAEVFGVPYRGRCESH